MRRALVLVSMTFANAMVLIDQTAIPLILPSVINELGIGSQLAQWIISASLLPLAAALVLGGKLGDLLGHRIVFVVGAVIFAGASACAGLAPDIWVLLTFRAVQGLGGALMLPTTIAIVSAAYPGGDRGRALGIMGGAAAVAGALGPAIGGGMTSLFGWRSVLLVNVVLAAIAVASALVAVRRDPPREQRPRIDLLGAALLGVALVGIVLGLSQSQVWGWSSPAVLGPIVVALAAGAVFVRVERRRGADALLDFALLRTKRNYLGATISQTTAGMVELGLGVIFPLLLILNLGMPPVLAGLALLPATIPMIVVAPLAGRWYDRVGGRIPLSAGYVLLGASGIMLALGAFADSYWALFPGLLVYGVALALVLSVNDPVGLDTLDERDHGQASGVSATGEQFGGALGIAVLYLVFHATYVGRLNANIDASPLADLTEAQAEQLRDDIIAAEQTGLNPATFDATFRSYLALVRDASDWGMAVAFLAVAVIAAIGLVAVWRLVRPVVATPASTPAGAPPATS